MSSFFDPQAGLHVDNPRLGHRTCGGKIVGDQFFDKFLVIICDRRMHEEINQSINLHS